MTESWPLVGCWLLGDHMVLSQHLLLGDNLLLVLELLLLPLLLAVARAWAGEKGPRQARQVRLVDVVPSRSGAHLLRLDASQGTVRFQCSDLLPARSGPVPPLVNRRGRAKGLRRGAEPRLRASVRSRGALVWRRREQELPWRQRPHVTEPSLPHEELGNAEGRANGGLQEGLVSLGGGEAKAGEVLEARGVVQSARKVVLLQHALVLLLPCRSARLACRGSGLLGAEGLPHQVALGARVHREWLVLARGVRAELLGVRLGIRAGRGVHAHVRRGEGELTGGGVEVLPGVRDLLLLAKRHGGDVHLLALRALLRGRLLPSRPLPLRLLLLLLGLGPLVLAGLHPARAAARRRLLSLPGLLL
mmetsp:Transcript_4754/g.14191  ORF Transcript_4754/g.14191 Transcript_4754/m.14191 type:complete len:361 (-) Transcript_4754:1048-2130(-)